MCDTSDLTDGQIRERLKFTPRWFEFGVVDDEWIAAAVLNFRESGDQGDEHYRYGAVIHFLHRHEKLTPEQCQHLFELGANDPDESMGTSIIIQVMDRPECPDEIYEAAAALPRSAKYAPTLPRVAHDPVAHRREVLAAGPEAYYRANSRKPSGAKRPDQTLYKEMRDLFGINFTQFHTIKAHVSGQSESHTD